MSTPIKSILRDYRHYRHFVLAALVLLLGLALLAQIASASAGRMDRQSLEANASSVINPASKTGDMPSTISNLVGHVTWQGILPPPRPSYIQPISLTLRMGSTEINYPSQDTDSSGFFTVSVEGLASGTYDYRAKGPKYLANAGTVTLTGAPTTQLEIGSMTVGDSDDNNVIDMVDYTILRAAVGASCGDPTYDARADFNNDCTINASDYTLLSGNVSRLGAPPDSPVPPSNGDAFMALQPGIAGNCNAPANGGTVQLGCRFVLDLMVNMGSIPNGMGQQSYLTFTNSIIQNARVSSIASSCTITSTLTGDPVGFDTNLANVVCNGPGTCAYRGMTLEPGSIIYPSGAWTNQPQGGTFRVAQIGFCAANPGQAVLHWQFSPPAPRNRHTTIVDANGNMVQSLFTDYVFNIVAPTDTPTPAPTTTTVIRGHGTWEGRQPQPDPSQILPISLTLRLTTGGPYVDYPLQNTDASGLFTVSVAGLPNGTYNWRAKGPQFLANAGTITLAGNPITFLEAGLLRTGDANGDNVVNINDFNILKGTFGRSCGQADYDGRADLTGDCVVNIQDFNLLRHNFGLSGAAPINLRQP
jgi:hypothetical protein